MKSGLYIKELLTTIGLRSLLELISRVSSKIISIQTQPPSPPTHTPNASRVDNRTKKISGNII